eukprot:jgi/Galph1/2114/GphlegSOOS_G798.1
MTRGEAFLQVGKLTETACQSWHHYQKETKPRKHLDNINPWGLRKARFSLGSPFTKQNCVSTLKANYSNTRKEKLEFSQVDWSEASAAKELVFDLDQRVVPETRVDVGYQKNCEDAVNNHIAVEYTASYAYHALFAFFDRDTVALPGFAKYFNDQSLEERQHAHEFIQYQNARGGKVVFKPIAVPEMKFEKVDATSDALYAMDLHLQLEKFVYKKLLDLHKVATESNDIQLQDFVEKYLEDQVKAVKTAAEYVAQIGRVGTGHGVYDIDRQLRDSK